MMTVAHAQAPGKPNYPSRAIRMVLPFPPGGATDIMARKIGQKMSYEWGQQVVIDNRAGAGGNIATELVARAAPDGHTLLFAASAQLAVNPSLYAKVPFDPVKDFAPVSLAGSVPNILVAHPSLGVKNLKELIALAKARPGQLNYATAGAGSTAHLSVELLKMETGIDIVHVPYRGAAPGVTDVLSGQVPLMMVSMPSVLGHVKIGKLRALGMTAAKRSEAAPDVATFAETIPNFESSAWYGMLAPAGTPQDIVDKLSDEVRSILRQPDVKEVLAAQGIEIIASTPSEFAAYIRTELTKWAAVVRKSGARVD
ncbi:MAG TPA: tripartite tricarboxylate transporter substrate binding protein [Burkholderiales bacterium]|nr:tripartite tricarboxylate transporter substrate binding protein [Burkholderiales bacterium]